MTDETEELTMAQACRVYAASGMRVSFTPEKLNNLADAIEGAEVMLAEAGEGLEKADEGMVKALNHMKTARRQLWLAAAAWVGLLVLAVLL